MATYLVTQATGQQSLAVIANLLAAGAKVHAVVRDLQKVPAALQKQGVTLFKGESVNLEEICQAAQGCQGAFLNTFPWPGLEAQQAKTIVEACKKAGIESIVASTTFTVGNKAIWNDTATDKAGLLEYFQSKAEVEDIVRGGNFKAYTILRPAVLHTDFMLPGSPANFPGLPIRGELDHGSNDGVRIPFTDTNEVGKYAAAALQDPAKFAGREIDLSAELLTAEEARDILVKVSGRDIGVRQLTQAELEAMKYTVFGLRFHLLANLKDFSTPSDAAKEVHAGLDMPLTSIESAVHRDKARLLDSLPAQ